MTEPWDLAESIAEKLEAIAEGLFPSEADEVLAVVEEIIELANDIRAGALTDNDRLAWADHLAHLHGEER